MTDAIATTDPGVVAFTGTRRSLFGLLFRGYLLMLPTIGIYRFWVTTLKRRFYWNNTVIDGDPLEYSGEPLQLLIGFLLALTVFLPIYVGFFFISTLGGGLATAAGYAAVAAILWFLTGYATYRGRDFRLSRTLWRGIRFDQKGSALRYAIRRFLWSLLVLLTLGLTYPFMAGSLWRYRYVNSWYGNRQFGFSGSWRTIAGPYYATYLLLVVIALFCVAGDIGFHRPAESIAWTIAAAVLGGLIYFWYRAREASKMFSCVSIGSASATVHVRAVPMFLQFVFYALGLAAALVVLALIGGLILTAVTAMQETGASGADASVLDVASIARRSWTGALAVIFGYLAIVSAFALMGEVFLGYGYWMLVARGASIANVESLRSVEAQAEDRSLMGEGLAEALNIGSY